MGEGYVLLGCRSEQRWSVSMLQPQHDNISAPRRPTAGPDLGSNPQPHHQVLLHLTFLLHSLEGHL